MNRATKTCSYSMLALYFVVVSCAAENAAKNVLFITIDDLNSDLGTYGHPLVKSPNIDALARTGLRFERAYVQAPQCTPSRSSFLTGVYPEQNGVLKHGPHFRDLIPNVITLPQHFKQNGFFTGRVGKIFHQGVPGQIGQDGMDDHLAWDKVLNPRGIDKDVEDQINSVDPSKSSIGGVLSWLNLPSEDSEHTDGKVALEAIKMLKDHHPSKTGKPFFIGVGFYRPHVPFIAPSKYFDLYPLDKIKLIKNPINDRQDIPSYALADRPHQIDLSEDKKREIIQGYYASISFVDAQVGLVLKELERLNLAKSTIVVLLSDHGYHLGHHGLWQKADLFEGSTKAPLIIAIPNMKTKGQATSSLVEFIDIYPTLVDLMGLKKLDFLSGISLAPILDNPNEDLRDSAYSVARTYSWTNPERRYKNIMGYTLRTSRYRYTQWGPDGIMGEELYDYDSDPKEFKNLANNNRVESVRFKLQRLLRDRIEGARQPLRSLE